jgi:hypothetical protein
MRPVHSTVGSGWSLALGCGGVSRGLRNQRTSYSTDVGTRVREWYLSARGKKHRPAPYGHSDVRYS